jgi:hypothetical protein
MTALLARVHRSAGTMTWWGEFSIEPALAVFAFAPRHAMARASRLPEILRHVAEGLQDYGIVEFAEVRIAAAGESHGSRIGIMPGDGFRAPDGGSSGRAFDRLPRSQAAAFFRRKGERHVIDHLGLRSPEPARP